MDADTFRAASLSRVPPQRSAGAYALELSKLLTHRARLGLLIPPLHIRDDPFERSAASWLSLPLRIDVVELDALILAAIEHDFANRLRKRLEGLLHVEGVVSSPGIG